MIILLALAGCAPAPGVLPGRGAEKAVVVERCDGVDNDGDGVVDEDCGQCGWITTRDATWWSDAECVVTGEGTGRSLLPVSVGTIPFSTWTKVRGALVATALSPTQRLLREALTARLNVAAFGLDDVLYDDIDGDGAADSLAVILAAADVAYLSGDDTTRRALAAVLAQFNADGAALDIYLDPTCASAPEWCDGVDNDGDGAVDEACGCVERCDGVDNDADGAVDQAPDADHDGYACDDCDDGDATIHPGAYDAGGDGIDQDCDGEDAPVRITYDDVQALYDTWCVSCHGGDAPEAGLDLTRGVSYAATVGVHSTQVPRYPLILPTDTDRSYLYRKVAGTHRGIVGAVGDRMPPGRAVLPFDQIEILAWWVTDGAAPDEDADHDGYGATDCDDADATVYPGAAEVRGDGIDQDCDGVDPSATLTVPELAPGDLLLTEIMQNPAVVSDSVGEWFEVQNTTPYAIELSGLSVSDASTGFTVGSSLVVGAGDYVVFGESSNTSVNGGVPVDYVYSGFALGNATDSIGLYASGVEIDRVAWDDGATFPDPTGASMTLDPDDADPTLNDDGSSWCEATSTYGSGDRGTPGAANDDCYDPIDADGDGWEALDDCDDGDPTVHPGAPEVRGDGIDQDCDGLDPSSTYTLGEIGEGDLVVTEVMYDPAATTDPEGEWFEIYNASGHDVDLDGLQLYDINATGAVQSTTSVTGTVVVPAGAYAVLGDTADPSLNGGVTLDYEYPAWTLANGGDEIYLTDGALTFDVFAWSNTTHPDPTGASIGLDPSATTAVGNDIASNWCVSTSPFGAGDYGTPGAENDRCFPEETDLDGDGWADTLDCDDADPAVNPHAAEAANGIDDDCDGVVDETDVEPFTMVFAANYDGTDPCDETTFSGCDLYRATFVGDTWELDTIDRITDDAGTGEMFPTIDHSGWYIAFEYADASDRTLKVYDRATTTQSAFVLARYPDFARHGDQLAYSDTAKRVHVLTYEPAGPGLHAVDDEVLADGKDPHWFPDGSQLIFHYQPDTTDTTTVLYDLATGVQTDFSDADGCAHASVNSDGTMAICQVGTSIMYRQWDGAAWGPYDVLLTPEPAATYGTAFEACDYLTFSYPEFCGDDDHIAVSANCVVGVSTLGSSVLVLDLATGAYTDVHGEIERYLGVSGTSSRTATCTWR